MDGPRLSVLGRNGVEGPAERLTGARCLLLQPRLNLLKDLPGRGLDVSGLAAALQPPLNRCQLHAENLDDLFARYAAVGGRKYLKPQVH